MRRCKNYRAFPSLLPFPSRWLCAACAHSFPPRERAHSLSWNDIGAEGARAFKEMFAFNGTLTTLDG
jgi:hypothetical protein